MNRMLLRENQKLRLIVYMETFVLCSIGGLLVYLCVVAKAFQ